MAERDKDSGCEDLDKELIQIKDPVHGYLRLARHEICLVSSSPMQRLRRLKQLSTSHLVYPGAVHTRFSHSLGSMYVAGVLAEYTYSKLGLNFSELSRLKYIARLLGLLHDVGHGPFSHTFEDHVLVNYGVNHEVLGGKIVREHPEVSKCFDDYIEKELGLSAEVMARLIEAPSLDSWPLTSSIGEGVSERTLYYIIKGAYSADIVDYLLRDSYFTGANYGFGLDWERLAYHSKPVKDRIVLEYKAKDVLDHLLIARIFMFKTVYYHKTVRAFDKIAGEMLIKADNILNYSGIMDDVNKYVELDDEYVLSNPSVRALDESRYLLNRVVPYKNVYQAVLPIDQTLKGFLTMSKDVIKRSIESRLRSMHPEIVDGENIIFVDTPKLPTNPMFEEAEVLIENEEGSIEAKPVRETLAGSMPAELAFLRIYVRDKHVKYANEVREVATSMLSGREVRSFY
ncbi:MAG: HD domain-containing protein [Zestosphaera sp.]